MQPPAPRKEKPAMLLFLFAANVWTWLLWIPPVMTALRQGWAMPSPDNYARLASEGFTGSQHLLLAVIFSLAVYGPLVGALLATAAEQGWRGARELLARSLNPRAAPRWYLAALLLAAAVAYLPALLAGLAGSLNTPLLGLPQRALLFVPFLILQMLTSGLGEEPGWRGYLLPRLQRRFSPGRTVWLLGLIWAAWHYPLTALYALQGVPPDVPAVGRVITVIVALLSQTIGVVGMTYLYVWLFNRTRSIFLMIVFHALTNTLPFLAAPPVGAFALVAGLVPWVVVLALRLIAGRKPFLAANLEPG